MLTGNIGLNILCQGKVSLIITLNIHFLQKIKILLMESAHVSFKVNRFANCLDVPPWPTGSSRLISL